MGFELFQGYYFAKPSLMEKKALRRGWRASVETDAFANRGTPKLMPLSTLSAKVPALTYKLLLLVNSVSLGLRVKVRNLRHAIATLGRRQIKRWAQLCLFASNGAGGQESPLIEMAAVRAAFMEQLAIRIPQIGRQSRGSRPGFHDRYSLSAWKQFIPYLSTRLFQACIFPMKLGKH